jgi:glycosyltransferase involved in cell wall biosynthesis
MVLVALFLKFMFNVPAFFFMHTDWLDFFKHTTNLDSHEIDRIRRLMRALYHRFDGIFVLNSDHQEWLSSNQIGLPRERVHLTAHHVEWHDVDVLPIPKSELIPGATERTPVLFTACRISREKGVLELPEIYRLAKAKIPDLRIVIAGSGPAEADLREALPEATFLGWVSRDRIQRVYAGLDLFVFPSRFDTFGNVILEAFWYGLPVLAYACKGPKDIIEHGKSGYLVNSIDEMAAQIVDHFRQPAAHAQMRRAALRRVSEYGAASIMGRFLEDLGLGVTEAARRDAVAA